LRIATDLIAADPSSLSPYLLRGQIALAGGRNDAAVADFRRVVFLAPSHKIARFWYAGALLHDGSGTAAWKQLRELAQQLAGLPEESKLEDGETTARELSDAVIFLREGLE
jgi:predicted Zn-dependent protease